MVLGHLLYCSGLIHLEVSSVVFPDSFCLSVCSSLLSSVIHYEGFYLHATLNHG
jgi:hypothetical protein